METLPQSLTAAEWTLDHPATPLWYVVPCHSVSMHVKACRSQGNICNLLFSQPSHSTALLSLPHTSPLFLLSSIRWQQTSKSSGLSSSLQPAGAKADALREEMEEAANRVEICRVPPFCSSLPGQMGEP